MRNITMPAGPQLSLLFLITSSLLAAPLGATPEGEPATPPPAAAPPPALPAPASAQGQGPTAGSLERLLASRPVVNQALTVDQAVAIGLRESPVVRGAVEEVEAAVGRLRAARAETRPWLSANLFASGGNNANIFSTPPVSQPQMIMGLPKGGFVDGNLVLMYPLFTSRRLQALVRQAAALRGASRADLETQRQEVALLTRAAYREVLGRRALIDVWQAKLRDDQERLRVDRLRLREGQIPAFYVLRDEAEVAATQQELTNAQRDAELSLVQLKTIMGISPASRIELTEPLEYRPSADLLRDIVSPPGAASAPSPGGQPSPPAPGPGIAAPAPGPGEPPAAPTPPGAGPQSPPPAAGAQPPAAPVPGGQLPPLVTQPLPEDLAALLRLAEGRRPELQAAGQRVRAAQAETAATRRSYQPQLSLFASGDLLNNDPNLGITFGAIASLPLYNGGQRQARIQTAEAERRRQERERERIALQVGQEVTGALLNLRAAEQNVETSRAALTAAQEDYRVALLRYESGRGILTEVLDALAARVRAESNVVQALFQYNVARDRLQRAVGEPTAAAPVPPGQPSGAAPGTERRPK